MIRDRGEPASAPDYPVLYAGHTGHYRFHPREHEFRKPVRMVHVDVDRLTELDDLPTWSATGTALMTVRVRDHLDGSDAPLGPRVRDLVRDELGWRPQGRITLLTQPRTWGYVFNPLSVYFGYDAEDRLMAVLYEVKNTFGGQHVYVLPTDPDRAAAGGWLRHSTPKTFYVSPFIGPGAEYRLRVVEDGDQLAISLFESEDGEPSLDAGVRLRRLPMSDANLARLALSDPAMGLKTIALIGWHAAKLWLRGVPWDRFRPRAEYGRRVK